MAGPDFVPSSGRYLVNQGGIRMTRISVRHASTTSLLAVSMAGLLVMTATSAQAAATVVPLGTADTYAILAGSGITNTGITTISGDVGSSPTPSETGFAACPGANCVTLTGANHNDPAPNDAETQGAKAALTNAYNNAAGQSPGIVLTELAGQTLVAGVYTSASRHLWHVGHTDPRRREQRELGLHLSNGEHADHWRHRKHQPDSWSAGLQHFLEDR